MTIRPRLRALLGRFRLADRASKGGNVALIFALTAPMVVGGAGLASETVYWYHRKLELQSAADAAAYAAAVDLRAGNTQTHFTSEASTAAAANGFDSTQGTITVNWPPASGTHQNTQAVEVLIAQTVPRFFSGLFVSGSLTENVRAVAQYRPASNACVLALNKTASGAVTIWGSATVTLTACSIMSNSLSSTAIDTGGSSSTNADCLISVGGVAVNSGTTETVCSTPITNAPPVQDPYGSLPAPTSVGSGPCLSGSITNGTLHPGNYCTGMDLKGTVTLENDGLTDPVYYVSGNLKINANAAITGSGITIYLAPGASVSINGNSDMKVSAPSTGTYAGVLFFGDRTNTGTVTINGDSASSMTGALYFPNQTVSYLGNFSGSNNCTQVVADQVLMSGSTTFSANCTGVSGAASNLAAYEPIRFVE